MPASSPAAPAPSVRARRNIPPGQPVEELSHPARAHVRQIGRLAGRQPPRHPFIGNTQTPLGGEARVTQQHTRSNAEHSSSRSQQCAEVYAGHAYQVVRDVAGSVCLRFLASKRHIGCLALRPAFWFAER